MVLYEILCALNHTSFGGYGHSFTLYRFLKECTLDIIFYLGGEECINVFVCFLPC